MKIYEAVSQNTGGVVTIKGKELNLQRFTLGMMVKYEEEGIDINKLVSGEKPATYLTKICFDLLDSEGKEEFNNDLTIFRNCLDVTDMESIMSSVTKALANSMPAKNEEGVSPQ